MGMVATTEHVLFYAFRYALGRTTYVVNDVIHDIRMNIGNISKATVENMLADLEKTENTGYADIDKEWADLVELLKKKVKSR
jgi:hypothetical protein